MPLPVAFMEVEMTQSLEAKWAALARAAQDEALAQEAEERRLVEAMEAAQRANALARSRAALAQRMVECSRNPVDAAFIHRHLHPGEQPASNEAAALAWVVNQFAFMADRSGGRRGSNGWIDALTSAILRGELVVEDFITLKEQMAIYKGRATR